jgi:hypothetical protein
MHSDRQGDKLCLVNGRSSGKNPGVLTTITFMDEGADGLRPDTPAEYVGSSARDTFQSPWNVFTL